MGYSLKTKLKVLKHVDLGITPIEQIVKIRKIPKQTIYRWLALRKRYGISILQNRTPGAKAIALNEDFEKLILSLWHERERSAHKMWLTLTKKGYTVSERQIQKNYRKHHLKMSKRSRPSQIKFVKYEWPKPNALWHTDWTTCPYTGKQLIAFIDDHSRFIVQAELFDHATTENTLKAFQKAIEKYGSPEHILTDNGTQFTPARTEKGPFTHWCEERGIKHILGRVHHPQTNGKIERWFGTYKSSEYKPESDDIDSFVKYYNEERLHQGIGYEVPLSRYKSNINVV
jgi:putative transposase